MRDGEDGGRGYFMKGGQGRPLCKGDFGTDLGEECSWADETASEEEACVTRF